MRRAPTFACFAAACMTAAASWAQDGSDRIVAIGGSVTEIVYALGQQDRLVARDTTSSWPPEALALPDVGYMRALSPEGVLSVAPGMILSEEGAGPPEAIGVLQKANIPYVVVPEALSREGILEKVRIVGDALGVSERAEDLASQLDDRLRAAEAAAAQVPEAERKRVLFVLSTAGGRVMAGGRNTSADAIITMAGGINAMHDFEGYKPVTDEAVAAAAPEVVLMMDRTGDHATGPDALFAMPALAATPAAEDRALVKMSGLLLLGFGPRTADAVTGLHAELYGE